MEYQVKLIGGIAVAVILLLAAIVVGYKLYQNRQKEDEPVLKEPPADSDVNILFLHHSTGRNIWEGGVKDGIERYNGDNGKSYSIIEQNFPKRSEYGWNNYPYDYWNIWVNHQGSEPYLKEPTLEMITDLYDVVVFKHCYPVSHVEPDTGDPDITSSVKSSENFKLQYDALKEKMHQFPDSNFILWTGAALVQAHTNEEEAKRASDFFDWVRNEWDEKGDNIFIWDFHELETEGGLYLTEDNAVSSTNSHPNKEFSKTAAPLLSKRIIDVIEGRGDEGSLTGE
ncbi:MAG: hypothetical protein ACMUIG_01575 [Thermoplasmatota archaeon]